MSNSNLNLSERNKIFVPYFILPSGSNLRQSAEGKRRPITLRKEKEKKDLGKSLPFVE